MSNHRMLILFLKVYQFIYEYHLNYIDKTDIVIQVIRGGPIIK